MTVDQSKEGKPIEANECKVCKTGDIVDAEQHSSCGGDGSPEQACFTCQDGDCKLPACKVETTPWKLTLAAELDKIGFINKIIDGLNEVGSKLPVPGGFEISKPTIAGSVENGDECCGECTADKDPIGQYVQLDGTESLLLPISSVIKVKNVSLLMVLQTVMMGVRLRVTGGEYPFGDSAYK